MGKFGRELRQLKKKTYRWTTYFWNIEKMFKKVCDECTEYLKLFIYPYIDIRVVITKISNMLVFLLFQNFAFKELY